MPARTAPVTLLLLALALVLAGCSAPAEHPSLRDAALPPLIQAHELAYHGSLHGGYSLSPDGRKLAWTGPSLMRKALFVRDNASGEVRKYRGEAGAFQWTADGRRLLYARDPSGAENTHVFMLDTDDASAEPVDLTPYPGIKAAIHQAAAASPAQLLVTHNRRDRRLFDLYRIDLDTREETLVARNPGDGVAPVTGRDGGFKGWQRSRDAQRTPEERRTPLAARRPALLTRPEETFRVLAAGDDGSFVWALSDRGRERAALVIAHPRLGWEKVVFEDPQVDVTDVVMSRARREPLIASAHAGYPRTAIIDPGLRADLAPLLQAQGNEPHGLMLLSADAAEKRLVVVIYTAATHRYYLVDRPTRSYTPLAEGVAPELAQALAPMQPVTIDARDGLRLHGYLTLPRGAAPKRLPMVLLVHGGPWLRTSWGNPVLSEDAVYAQFLANRGYAVLQVDFRGSVGYGHRFLAAGIAEFAGRMQEDLLDAMRWAVDAGIADPGRVAIMGWSYGGYAALVGMTMTPDVFACGVSLGGPTDLASLIESFPAYWSVDLSRWHDHVGDPANAEDREDMTARSPLTHAQKLKRPVLLVHGARDVRVKIDQAERMVAALRVAGKPVEYLRIADMGHSSGYWMHRLAVLRRTETFLQHCLGGRASRFDPFDAVAWVWGRVKR